MLTAEHREANSGLGGQALSALRLEPADTQPGLVWWLT